MNKMNIDMVGVTNIRTTNMVNYSSVNERSFSNNTSYVRLWSFGIYSLCFSFHLSWYSNSKVLLPNYFCLLSGVSSSSSFSSDLYCLRNPALGRKHARYVRVSSNSWLNQHATLRDTRPTAGVRRRGAHEVTSLSSCIISSDLIDPRNRSCSAYQSGSPRVLSNHLDKLNKPKLTWN